MEKKYFIQEDGKVSQAYSIDALRAKNITATTLVCEKFGNWKHAKEIPELAELIEWQPSMPDESDWVPPPPNIQTPNTQQPQQFAQEQYQVPAPPHTSPSNPQQQTIVIAGLNRKSTGVAFILSFLFGPLGLFYASVTGGVVMLVLSLIIGIVTFGVGLVIPWIGSIIWAVVAVNNHNEKMNKLPGTFNPQPQAEQQQYQQYQQSTSNQQHEQIVSTSEVTQPSEPVMLHQEQQTYVEEESSPPPTIAEHDKPEPKEAENFISRYKIPLIIGIAVIAVGFAGYTGYKFLLKKELHVDNLDKSTTAQNYQQPNITEKKTPTFVTEIPTPRVAIVKAANVLPNWSEYEELYGNHLLIGLYVGSLGNSPFKISITGVDTLKNTVVGFSSVKGNRVDFEGIFTMRYRKAPTHQSSNIVDFGGWVFDMVLFEPKTYNKNGVFQINLEATDAHGSSGSGTWISYDGQLYRGIELMDTYVAGER